MKMLFLVEIEGELELDPESICAVISRGVPPSVYTVTVTKAEVEQPLPPAACPYCKGTGKGTWTMGNSHIATHCLYCRGTGKTA